MSDMPIISVSTSSNKWRGRWRMLAVLLLCAAPVIASYLMYYVVRPEAHTNYGELIAPQRAMPTEAGLQTLAGKDATLTQLRGNWLLVSVDSGVCDKRCTDKLYWMRQLRTSLGKERNRLDRVWLIDDENAVSKELMNTYAGTYTLRMNPSLADNIKRKWLITPASTRIQDHLYLIDPQGNAMMRFPKDADANKIKRDISKLLRASASWQTAKPPQIEGGAMLEGAAL
jgi:hypothetical protein